MVLWYREPTKDSKFANLSCSEADWESINSKIVFKEVAIKETDDFYHLFGYADEVTDIKFYDGGKNWKFEPQLIKFKVAKQDYNKYSKEEKKDVPAKQSVAEKFYCLCLKGFDQDKVYTGKIYFQMIPQIQMLIDGQLNEQLVEATITSMCSLTALTGASEIIKLDEIQLPTSKSSGYGSGSKAQSEAGRLDDRLQFLVKQLNLIFPDLAIDTLADLYKHYNDEKMTVQVQQAVELIKVILSNDR